MKEWPTYCWGQTVISNLVWNVTGQLSFLSTFFGFDPALMEVFQLVFETMYDNKKDL